VLHQHALRHHRHLHLWGRKNWETLTEVRRGWACGLQVWKAAERWSRRTRTTAGARVCSKSCRWTARVASSSRGRKVGGAASRCARRAWGPGWNAPAEPPSGSRCPPQTAAWSAAPATAPPRPRARRRRAGRHAAASLLAPGPYRAVAACTRGTGRRRGRLALVNHRQQRKTPAAAAAVELAACRTPDAGNTATHRCVRVDAGPWLMTTGPEEQPSGQQLSLTWCNSSSTCTAVNQSNRQSSLATTCHERARREQRACGRHTKAVQGV
jgi:hypothetical protein